jgi:hypothetical protein
VKIDGLIATVEMGVCSGEKTVFEVLHHPGAIARTVAPHSDIAKVDGFHVAVAGIVVACLGIPVVEAAAAVVVRAVEDRVLAL